MKHKYGLFAAMALTLMALPPSVARADDWDDLDVTMEVVTDVSELDAMIAEMVGPNEGAAEEREESVDVVAEDHENNSGDVRADRDGGLEEEMEDARHDEFEHGESEFEVDNLEREDDFEDGEDVDEDEYDEEEDEELFDGADET